MIKSVICIVCVVLLLVINTVILFLKPEFNFAQNDETNYCVYYQKWIRTAVYMSSIIMALFCVYFAIELKQVIAYILLSLVCLLVVIYALCKYKGITVNGEDIKVERLFRKELKLQFKDITRVHYIPNARLSIQIRRREGFDVSFNSENFRKFYNSLLASGVKFKTGRISSDEACVCLSKFGITIKFPKTMFREYYQSKTYFRNSNYLFSARSLENHEYIEAYSKESAKEIDEFVELVKNDLKVNNYSVKKVTKENINGFEMMVIKGQEKTNKNLGRLAYIYPGKDSYLVIYADYLLENEEAFVTKMNLAIKETSAEDNQLRFARI